MAKVIEIQALDAPELNVYARLTEAQLRSSRHPQNGLFIAESLKVIGHALEAGYEPVSFLMERRQINGQARAMLDAHADVPVYTANRELLASLTGYALTRGALCAMRRPPLADMEKILAGARRVAVLERIADPTNLGAIFRSAAALNVDAVLVTPDCCDPLHRRAVRVSMGTVFQVPWARIGEAPSDWYERGADMLRARGFCVAALALDARSISIDDPVLKAQERLAILLGTEGDGLSEGSIASSDFTVKIPMAHGVDSLNVAAASAVAFWELCAARR